VKDVPPFVHLKKPKSSHTQNTRPYMCFVSVWALICTAVCLPCRHTHVPRTNPCSTFLKSRDIMTVSLIRESPTCRRRGLGSIPGQRARCCWEMFICEYFGFDLFVILYCQSILSFMRQPKNPHLLSRCVCLLLSAPTCFDHACGRNMS
jgi:hypothetical protein